MRTSTTALKPVLAVSALALGLSAGCTRKSTEEKKAEIRTEAAEDIAETRRDAAEELADTREEIADTQKEANEDIAELNRENRAEVAEERRENIGASGERAKVSAEESKDNYAKSLTDKLNAIDDRIDTVEDRVDDKGESAKTAFAADLADLKAKRQAAAVHVKNVKDAEEANWQDMRQGADQAFSALEASIKKAEDWVSAH